MRRCSRSARWDSVRGVVIFFFQAEDGIRDGHVTGVQTCALPICACHRGDMRAERFGNLDGECAHAAPCAVDRSEERRVGKECRCRWWGEHEKNKGYTLGIA